MKKENNAKIINMDGGEIKSTNETTNEEVEDKSAEDINLIVHPNVMFGVRVKKTETKSGIILPEGTEKGTPIAEIMAIGENVEKQFKDLKFSINVGDAVYVDGSYVRPAVIDGVEGVILMPDGIFGKVKPVKEEDK